MRPILILLTLPCIAAVMHPSNCVTNNSAPVYQVCHIGGFTSYVPLPASGNATLQYDLITGSASGAYASNSGPIDIWIHQGGRVATSAFDAGEGVAPVAGSYGLVQYLANAGRNELVPAYPLGAAGWISAACNNTSSLAQLEAGSCGVQSGSAGVYPSGQSVIIVDLPGENFFPGEFLNPCNGSNSDTTPLSVKIDDGVNSETLTTASIVCVSTTGITGQRFIVTFTSNLANSHTSVAGLTNAGTNVGSILAEVTTLGYPLQDYIIADFIAYIGHHCGDGTIPGSCGNVNLMGWSAGTNMGVFQAQTGVALMTACVAASVCSHTVADYQKVTINRNAPVSLPSDQPAVQYMMSQGGVAAVQINAAGTCTTPGTYALTFSGGTGPGTIVAPVGTYTVTGTSISSTLLSSPGSGYYSSSVGYVPAVGLAAGGGCTGATLTAIPTDDSQPLYNAAVYGGLTSASTTGIASAVSINYATGVPVSPNSTYTTMQANTPPDCIPGSVSCALALNSSPCPQTLIISALLDADVGVYQQVWLQHSSPACFQQVIVPFYAGVPADQQHNSDLIYYACPNGNTDYCYQGVAAGYIIAFLTHSSPATASGVAASSSGGVAW